MKLKGLKRFGMTLAAVFVASAVTFGATSVSAATGATNATQTINGGTKNITATSSATFNSITLNGESQSTSTNPGSLAITDSTGIGEGWRVTASATQFTVKTPASGFRSGTTAKKLPTGSLKLTNASSSINANGTTSDPPSWVGSSWTIDSGSPSTILSAAANQGMGKYNVNFGSAALTLGLAPATTYVDKVNYPSAGTPYESVITYTLITGP